MQNKQLNQIHKNYLQRKIGLNDTLNLIEQTVGKIESSRYKQGKLFTINGCAFQHSGFGKKKHLTMTQDLGLALYYKSHDNGYYNRSEYHAGKNASTKHHKNTLLQKLQNIKRKWN